MKYSHLDIALKVGCGTFIATTTTNIYWKMFGFICLLVGLISAGYFDKEK